MHGARCALLGRRALAGTHTLTYPHTPSHTLTHPHTQPHTHPYTPATPLDTLAHSFTHPYTHTYILLHPVPSYTPYILSTPSQPLTPACLWQPYLLIPYVILSVPGVISLPCAFALITSPRPHTVAASLTYGYGLD